MNQINPRKLELSKWTAVQPINSEKQFLVTEVEFDDKGTVMLCILQAVTTKREASIDWHDLKDSSQWRQGWG